MKHLRPAIIYRLLVVSAAGFVIDTPSGAAGGIATDGTLGAIQTFTGANVTIPQPLGATVGRNLFHSFAEFNIANGQTVEFTGSNALKNVITRVTGADKTDISGTLKSSIANAAFYFINPNGVTFTEHAQVDVPGDFHVSTADELRLKNGGLFSTVQPEASVLSAAAPEAYGFLGDRSAEIQFLGVGHVGKNLVWQGTMQVDLNPGSTLDLVSGNLAISGSQLRSESGEVRLLAMRGAGIVNLARSITGELPLPEVNPSLTNSGSITIDHGSIETSGSGAGRIAAWGGNTSLTAALVFADNLGNTNAISGKGVDIFAYSLSIDNAAFSAETWGKGNAGAMSVVVVKSLTIDNDGVLQTGTNGEGNGGNMIIMASTINTLKGAKFASNAASEGDGGNISINADTWITDSQGNKTSGTILLNSPFAKFAGNSTTTSGIYGSGNAGSINVNVKNLFIYDSARISSNAYGSGNAGQIVINADKVVIDSKDKQTIHLDFLSGLDEQTEDVLTNPGIRSDAQPGSLGHAGSITINARILTLADRGNISSDTFSSGSAGTVTVNADVLEILNDSNISSAARAGSSGKIGDVNVTARQSLQLGSGGNISIENEADGSSASDTAEIKPGAIAVTAPKIELRDSRISTLSTGDIAAGNIDVNISRWLTLNDSTITTSAKTGDGGNITIGESGRPPSGFLLLNTGNIQANTIDGTGGDIMLNLTALITSGNMLAIGGEPLLWQPSQFGFNIVQAASQAGESGTLAITSPQLNLSGVVANLGAARFGSTDVKQAACGLYSGSSLTLKGTGGLMPKAADLEY